MNAGPLDLGRRTREEHDPLLAALDRFGAVERVGRVAEAYGTLVRATGIKAAIGEVCELRSSAQDGPWRLLAEVVGVSRQHTLLTPLGPLEGISAETEVVATGHRASVRVGTALLGRVLDAHAHPIDGRGPLDATTPVPLYVAAPDPMTRRPIARVFPTGVRAIDSVLTVGEGQRLGIFAAAGGGKSTLMGMLARNAHTDVNVIALVGERGREVGEFIQDNLGAEGLARSVIVAATSDRPALERSRAAWTATAIAEHFRARGQRVMLLVDSVTRFARALRDVGLAVGEPPARRGFPPSVFGALPVLFERAGNDAHGSITAFYTVLMEGEDADDPVAEEVRSLLDGHLVLSRRLAAVQHYPAIDVSDSLSRCMPRIASPQHVRDATQLRRLLARYQEVELLLQLGEYKRGADAEADAAIDRIGAIRRLLCQNAAEPAPFDATVDLLARACR